MKRPIILAPAGTAESVRAAVRCGADAVYLGGKSFNARRNAENFDADSLRSTVEYCHGRGTRVFVTVNTLVRDGELPLLEAAADEIAESGADAVILQDMAAMELFARRYPDLPRHASTQTAVHNLDGARYLEDLGCRTVVLARELTLGEIEYICAHTDAECEVFVHGAHCMSVSGACYLSAMLGGRSGNRGLCAQPCRLDWQCGDKDHALSLKDMSLLSHLRELESAGVGVFKIEGRMKRPEYVAAAVTACRRSLDGEPYDEGALRAVFSRSGFTDGYLTGRRDGDMFGHRTKEDVTGAEKVLKSLAALYDKETPRAAVSMDFAMDSAGSRLTVSDGEHTVTAAGPVPETALRRPTDAAAAEKNLVKTGGTPFYVEGFAAQIGDGLMLPAAALNAMRRGALDALLAERGAVTPWTRHDAAVPAEPRRERAGEPALWARFADAEQIPAGEEYAKIILPVARITPGVIDRFGDRLIGQLPALLWPEDEAALAQKLAVLRDAGLREVWGENLYAIPLARRLDLGLHGGPGLNVLNTRTLLHFQGEGLLSVTASFEMNIRDVKALGGTVPLGLMTYGYLPLMRFRNCPVRAAEGCGICGGRGELTDRRGIRFGVECGEKKYASLLNSVPLHIAERDLRGADHLILWFTRETAAECAHVTEDFRQKRKSEGPRTGGLYYRELL